MKAPLPYLLSFTGGYVDTAGFLALQGLFTAHVTGNFVTLGAAFAFGTSGVLAKLLALPVFCAVILSTQLLGHRLARQDDGALLRMLCLQLLLLTIGSALAIRFGPFRNADAWPAVVTGMVLVAAMAVQNASHRSHLMSAPPSTLMTGTTTQIMIDLADLISGVPNDQKSAVHTRLSRMSWAVSLFAAGCASAALLYSASYVRCFAAIPLLGLLAVGLSQSRVSRRSAAAPDDN